MWAVSGLSVGIPTYREADAARTCRERAHGLVSNSDFSGLCRRGRLLRACSQRSESEVMATKLVDYVLMAEFDIDKGSVCRVQYPSQCGDATQASVLT